MPRFYFDIRDSEGTARDDEGLIFATLEDAIQEAKKALHEMARDEPGLDHSGVAIDIRQGEESMVTVTSSTTILPQSSSPVRQRWKA
jgi:hypothetical protein